MTDPAALIAEARKRAQELAEASRYAVGIKRDTLRNDAARLDRLADALEASHMRWMRERTERLDAEIEAYGEGRMSRSEVDAKGREIARLHAAIDAAKGGSDG